MDIAQILKEKAEAFNTTLYNELVSKEEEIKALQEQRRKIRNAWDEEAQEQLELVGKALKASFPKQVVIFEFGKPSVRSVVAVECKPRLTTYKNLPGKIMNPAYWYVQSVRIPEKDEEDICSPLRLDYFLYKMSMLGDQTRVFTEDISVEELNFILMVSLKAHTHTQHVHYALQVQKNGAVLSHTHIPLGDGKKWSPERVERVLEGLRKEGWQASYSEQQDLIHIPSRLFWFNEAGEKVYLTVKNRVTSKT